jgi:membrane protease YdiL (CAAX protease family)
LNRRLGAVIASVGAFVGVLLFQKALSLLFFSRIVIPSSWNVPVNETASLILRSVVLLTVAPFVYVKRSISGISMHRKLDRGLIFMATLICVSNLLFLWASNNPWRQVATTYTLIVPLTEELLFRGYILGKLKTEFGGFVNMKIGLSWAVIGSALLFGIWHVPNIWTGFSPSTGILQVFFTIVGGLIFGVLREKTGTIYASVLLHMITNAFDQTRTRQN